MLRRTLLAAAAAVVATPVTAQDTPIGRRRATTPASPPPPPPPPPPAAHHAAHPAAAAPQHRVLNLRPIEPDNALEYAFVAAFDNEQMRPAFRQRLLESSVALATSGVDADSPLLMVPLQGGVHAAAIFTSPQRLTSVLGPNADYVTIPGREALRRAGGEHVVINYGLAPMLTLDPSDVAHFLGIPTEPSQ